MSATAKDQDLTKPPAPQSAPLSASNFVVVAASLILTFGAWKFSNEQIQTRIEARFEASAQRTIGLLEDRMQRYEDALWSSVAAINALSGEMTHQEWKTFAESLRLPEKYPGINGIGVINFVSTSGLEAFEAEQRLQQPAFDINPAYDGPLAMPITYIEPLATNRAALGLDIAHETNRRQAAITSRDSGNSQITGPIVLVQDESSTSGFLFFAPFYEGGRPNTVAERRARAIGAVYAPFIVKKLMDGLLSEENRDLRFGISDAETLIYDEHSTPDELTDPDPMFRRNFEIELYGRTWITDMATNLRFRSQNTYVQPDVILAGGLVIEALVIAILVSMTLSNRRAHQHAKNVTHALHDEKEKLAKTNQELEQFVYVASHDLKTPVRGIGGLTEMIKEDLEPYFASANADPIVDHKLDRILDRVGRINALTDGIIQYSQVGHGLDNTSPLGKDEIERILRQDFYLSAKQLRFSCDVETILCDGRSLLRVLENLVSNAVKYHNAPGSISVEVSITAQASHLDIRVTDNGPGIPNEFHSKVFEPFQTLSSMPAPGSNGIGLASVKKCVEMHGYKVDLRSTPGQGCSFSFSWPRHLDQVARNFEKVA
ncbi:MAG: CHASE domain-containing protein [Pseudomonadota bacterium]